ncbi:MAG: dihydroneopterin aldolase [Candidatus Marinimicrobia bacterium]|nr:dihydroneopterin aldolase [Candidatus Neomarinimicrobiota bacterium]
MEIIKLKNMKFYGFHGVEKEEKKLGGRFEVDITLECNLQKAIETDNLEDTINYEAVYNEVKKIITATKHHYLLESLAGKICKRIKTDFELVKKVTTTIRKPNVPIQGVLDTVEVVVTL